MMNFTIIRKAKLTRKELKNKPSYQNVIIFTNHNIIHSLWKVFFWLRYFVF